MKLGITLVAVCVFASCAGPVANPPAPKTTGTAPTSFARLKARVARDMAIVTEGSVPGTLRDDLLKAVEGALQAKGIVIVYGDSPCDLTIRLETRATGAISFLRGHLTVLARHGEGLVAQSSTGTETYRAQEFSTQLANKAVQGLTDSPGFLAFARKLAPAPVVQPPVQPRPRVEPINLLAKAKAHSQRATAFYNLGRYREALQEYENAYLVVTDPPFLFNIGQCHRKLGNQDEALKFFRNYLRVAPEAPNHAEVERWISELSRNKHATR